VASTLIAQLAQPSAASEQRGVTLEAWLLYWGMVQLTIAEEATVGGRATLDRMEASVDVHFRLFDQDRDGCLAVAEYRHYVIAWGLTTDAAHNFQRLDRDGDGYLRPAELAEYRRQFHFSNDPDASGNAFYGEFQE
jgi:Ca2+-binding EF-hand superfamily protein